MNTRHLTDFVSWLKVERGYSLHTVDGYSRDVTAFFACVGDEVDLPLITREHISTYLASLYSVNSSATVARKMSALRTFFRFIIRQGVMSYDPLAGVAGPKLAKYIPVFLTVDEVFSLLEQPGKQDTFYLCDRAVMELLYST